MGQNRQTPQHIGIIMDGNGRWAKQRGLVRSMGHKEGLKSAKSIVHKASTMGIPYLSLYVFSTENWKRTEDEVSYLMQLIKTYLIKEFKFYFDNQIKVVFSGDESTLPKEILTELDNTAEKTKDFQGLTVNLLINYGGQDEIVRSVNKAITMNPGKEINQDDIYQNFDHPEIPPLDLVIRSAGEKRLSNFMIWQAAYSEFYYTNKLWPDFNEDDFMKALDEYHGRDRKFGGY